MGIQRLERILGSAIEAVNLLGSYFYGSILGVFGLAVLTPRATARGAFYGLLAGMTAVFLVSRFTSIAFLWYNVVGAVAGYLADAGNSGATENDAPFGEVENEVKTRYDKLLGIQGNKTVRDYWWDLGRVMWDKVGMARDRAGLEEAIQKIGALREEYWQNVKVPGDAGDLNKHLEMAGRVADFFELGELMARDALMREESCGGHFREEHQTPEGEALRERAW